MRATASIRRSVFMATRNVYTPSFVATAQPVWCWLGVLPALVIVLVLVVYPLAVAMLTSLQTEHRITLGRYVRFFTTPRSYTILLETLAISGLATVGSVILSVPLAYVIRRYERTRAFLRVLITTPLAVPVLISAYALTLFFAEHGLFNYLVVHVLHLSPRPLAISYTWPGLILACVWRFFPYTALVVAGALEGLDRSIEEAAYSTGARPHQVFLRISLPLLTPAIVTGSVLTFIGAFGTFSIPLVMGRGQDVLSVVAYRAASSFDSGSAATIVDRGRFEPPEPQGAASQPGWHGGVDPRCRDAGAGGDALHL
jgi:iron(III) transport system permease protein